MELVGNFLFVFSILCALSVKNLSLEIGIMRKRGLLIVKHIIINFLGIYVLFVIKLLLETVNIIT